MDFSDALRAIRHGKLMQRVGWNGKGMYVFFVSDQRACIISGQAYAPHVVMLTVDKKLVPWLVSQTDLLAEDWQEFVISSEVSTS